MGWATNIRTVSDLTDPTRSWPSPPATARMRSWCRRRPPVAVRPGVDNIRRDQIELALRSNDWTGAAVNAANGLGCRRSTGSGPAVAGAAADHRRGHPAAGRTVVLLWSRRRAQAARGRGGRRQAGGPDRPQRAGGGPHRRPRRPVALDRRRRRQRGADQQQRVGLAVEEFGQAQTEPFAKAVEAAKVILAQAFNVRQQPTTRCRRPRPSVATC